MGAQTRTVGGGSATQTADNFNAFLNSMMMGPQAQQPPQRANMAELYRNGGMEGIQNHIRQQQSNAAQPHMQTSAFGQAFNGMLGGNVNDLSGSNAAIQQYFQNPTNQFTNQYTAPEFTNANLSQLPTNFGQGQTGMANLSGYGNAAQSNFNPMQQLREVGGGNLDSMLQSLIGQGANATAATGFNPASAGQGVELAPGMSYQDAYNTLGQDPLLERNRMKAAAEMRARFGAEGAGALGTGAQVAEGNLNAELLAQDASARRGQSMQLMGQDLSERMGGANTALGSRSQDVQAGIANMQGSLQGAQNENTFNSTNFGNLLSAATSGRGQDLSAGVGMRGQDLSQLGLGLNQSMFNTGQSNNMQSTMINAMLQNQGLGNNFGLGAAGLNNNAMQQNNMNGINMAGMANNFNLGNAQNMANFGNAAQTGNANFFQQMLGMGNNMNAMGNNNTANMLAQLFGGMGQSNAIGNPQAQMIQQPSTAGQLLNAGLTIGGGFLGGPAGAAGASSLGSMFGGSGYTPGMNVGQMPTNLFGGPQFGNFGGLGMTPSSFGGFGMPTSMPSNIPMPVFR